MKALESQRLYLREWKVEDAKDLFEYAQMITVGPNAGWKPHENIEESQMIISRFMKDDDTWAIVLKENNKVIGSVGLHKRIDLSGDEVTELGYVLSTNYEGRGFMTEACRSALEFAFTEQQVSKVKVMHYIKNFKSQRVIEKCGFIYEKEIEHDTKSYGIKTSKVYVLTKENYFNKGERQ
ncbi:MAG: GNAT family N-acetyltransferase [Firmicutes bacterium]|nr:GNAT family N-acetyltransferase [Bacillota bacterium]